MRERLRIRRDIYKSLFITLTLSVWATVFPTILPACLIAIPLLLASRLYQLISAVMAAVVLALLCIPPDVGPDAVSVLGDVLLCGQALLTLLHALSGRLLDSMGEARGTAILRCLRSAFWGTALLALASTTLKPVLLLVSVFWTVIFAGFWWSLRAVAPRSRSWTRADFLNVAVFCVSAGFCLLFMELAARLIFPPEPPPADIIMLDPDYVFTMRPASHCTNFIRTSDEDGFHVTYEVTGQGLRDREYGPKATDEFRILMLGDSNTMGWAVEPEDTIPRLIETALIDRPLAKKITVMNAGLCAAGPLQELGMLRKYGMVLNPDLVILQLLPLNDVDDSLLSIGKATRAYSEEWHRRLRDRQRAYQWPYRIEAFLRRHSILYQRLTLLTGCRQLFVASCSKLRFLRLPKDPPLPPCENRWANFEVNLVNWYPELDEGMALVERYVREIKAECDSRGIDMMAFCLSHLHELNDADWLDFAEEFKSIPYERYKGINLFEDVLAREKIPCIPVVDAQRAYPDKEAMFYRLDGHCTPLGHRIIADAVAEYLLRDYCPGKGLTNNPESAPPATPVPAGPSNGVSMPE